MLLVFFSFARILLLPKKKHDEPESNTNNVFKKTESTTFHCTAAATAGCESCCLHAFSFSFSGSFIRIFGGVFFHCFIRLYLFLMLLPLNLSFSAHFRFHICGVQSTNDFWLWFLPVNGIVVVVVVISLCLSFVISTI